MERTSSLELFRGSDAFSSLAFLDGQDANREANSCHTIVEGLQPSQAIPASMPVASLHLTDPTQGPSKLLHSRLASGFSAWPQTASTPYTSIAMHHPASARHSFLPFGTPASQHAAGTADCQADSFAALLADDTALGFADDCFRRESDLYLSQDRAMPSDAAHREGLQSNADEDGFAIQQPQHLVMASGQPAVAPASTQPAATASAPHQHPTGDTAPVIASPQTAPLHSPAMATLSQEAAAAQPPTTTSSQHPPPPVTEDTCPSAACAGMTADPQAAHGQQQPAGSGAQTRPDALGPTQASPQTSITNKQEHMMPAAASSSPVAGLKGKDSDVNSIGASSSISPKANQAVLRLPQQSVPAAPQTQAVLSPQRARAPMHTPAVSAQPAQQSTHPDAAGAQAAAPPEIRAQSNAAADATAADAAAAAAAAAAGSDSQLPQGAGRLQQGAQVCAPHSQQQVLGSDHSAVAGPKLAVQDYQLPLPPTAQDTPATIPWAQQAPAQPLVRQGTHHTRLAEDASASLDMGGPSEPPVIRHWGHHIVSKVMNAFPGRTQQLPTPSAAAGAASDAASLEGTQAAGPSQRPQSATAKPGTGATHQTQPPSDAVDSRQATTLPQMPAAPQLKPPAQNGNAFRQQVFSHSAGDLITTQPVAKVSGGTGTQAGFQRHSPQVTPLSEAAVLANRQDPAMPMGPQQDYPKSQHSAPSILQDLRDAAAQGCLQQPQNPSAPICVLSSEQALLDPIQPRQQAPLLEEAHSSQETASTQQAHRPSIASSGTDPSSSGGAPPSYPTQPCSEAQPPAAQATPAGLDHGQQLAVAVASQRLVEEAAAVADHPDSPPPAPEVAAVARALQEKQPVVRSLRLFEKRAAAEQAAVLRKQDVVLKAAVEQTGVDLASRLAAADSAVPLVLAECLASKRSKRVPGGDPLEAEPFRRFVDMVRSNSPEFEAQGRVLRLKQYISADVRPAAINAILEALAVNTLVEVLYIQNFEQGMFDEQLLRLMEVLKKGRIWALNAGENFEISLQAWETFTKELQHTAVAYMYVSEHHLARTDLKRRMQDAIRENRRQAPQRDSEVIKCVGNMWWNPKLPADPPRPVSTRAPGGESGLASLARDMVASQAGSRQSGSGSQSKKRRALPHDTAVSSQGEGSCLDCGKPGHPKRPRSLATAHAASPHIRETGSTDSQAEAGLGTEKRSLRIKRRQQRQRAEDPEQESQGGVHTNTVTADASSPVPSLNRTHDSSPTGRGRRTKTKTVGLRSRLADQSGPISDNSDNDEAAAADGAAVHLIHFGDEDEPSRTAVTGEPVASRNAQKRKRPQQQQSTPAVATASSVQPTISTEASDRLDADVMTEHSRSSEAATPVGRHRRRGQGGAHTKPETSPLLHEQQTEQELDSGQSRGGALRRTGRQRKLTPAAAAAVEDFPSLYRNPGKPPATAQKEKNLGNSSSLSPASDTAREHDEVGAAGAVASPERGRRHAAPGGGGSQVQMSQLVRCGVVPAGTHELLFMGSHACQVEVLSDGDILYQGDLYDSLTKFGKALLEETGSSKQSCNAWRDLSWQGQRLETWRQAAYAKSLQAKRLQKK